MTLTVLPVLTEQILATTAKSENYVIFKIKS